MFQLDGSQVALRVDQGEEAVAPGLEAGAGRLHVVAGGGKQAIAKEVLDVPGLRETIDAHLDGQPSFVLDREPLAARFLETRLGLRDGGPPSAELERNVQLDPDEGL